MGSFIFKSLSKKPLSLFINSTLLFLICFYVVSNSLNQPKNTISGYIHLQNLHRSAEIRNCSGVHKFTDYESKCRFVKSTSACWGNGYVNYLEIFYCNCGKFPGIGYLVLLLWLFVLFYVLGNTTSEYFCPSVESLARVLKLSPTIAGTTLLPLGNGANDVFASIISFTRSGDGDVGLNSVLGGAIFISCFVVGVISITVSSRRIMVDERSFIRDVLFILLALCCLIIIMIFGKISLWFAICFLSVYFLYIATVSVMHMYYSKKEMVVNPPVLDELGAIGTPLLGYVDEESSDKVVQLEIRPSMSNTREQKCYYLNLLLYVLELPIYLPRRLTIPAVSEEKWSKPFAVCSALLSPIFLAALWNLQVGKTSLAIYVTATLVGIILGISAIFSTRNSSPPRKCLLLWLVGGFLMSIAWTYITAEELVSLLVAFGNILGISPSFLGLTVLAWGNSVGDLISNLTMAIKGGPDGAQIAVSGCYAGPLFNTLVGLGLSLLLASWSEYPSSYVIPRDSDLYETIGFFIGGLLWALVVLPKRNMQLDKCLGIGLLAIYLCFLFTRLVKGLGLLKIN
ncbi:cation/calcium exchanger 1 [Olea europaea var. sylvestris]|uniref:cation/calcium exchanger 1 n=1 Tax=Olea europaea var. sylvestris TaxID=158386 RepID=UPI000C1D4E27|nr:cation/calcium exchanger 1 [Olea europaea var. sylvestris]